MKYSKEYLIKCLQSLGKKNISKSYIDNNKDIPSSATFSRYFGTFGKAIQEAGLETGIISGRPQDKPIIINDDCLEIINGELLGDGCIYFSGEYRTNACFAHSTANIHYGKYLYDKLKEKVPLLKPEIQRARNNAKEQFRTRSTTNKSWTNIRNKWYIGGAKIIPNDLLLSKETCLHWYLGDGYFEGTCKISTCSFSYIENIRLSKMLCELGFYTEVKQKGKYFILKMNKKSSYDFLSWIGDCPVLGYKHRWNRRENNYEEEI